MKSIDTLIEDVYALFEKTDWSPNPAHIERFGNRLARHISARASQARGNPSLRFSNLGTECDAKLWHHINNPEGSEALSPSTKIKFLFGDILEELLLFLAEEAGHHVVGQQDELEINGVVGHRDAIIDGRLVDVKSASSIAFRKFKEHKLPDDDPFGYITQLGAYLHASREDPRVVNKDIMSFFVIDKQMGTILLDTYRAPEIDYPNLIETKVKAICNPSVPPRGYEPVADGKSGNEKLCTQCSYCNEKWSCWGDQLRTFIYSTGPVYLTKVERQPKVVEVDREGAVVNSDF